MRRLSDQAPIASAPPTVGGGVESEADERGLHVIRELGDSDQLGPAWDRMAAAGGPIATRAWTEAWTAVYGSLYDLHVLTLGEPSSPHAIVPLVRPRRRPWWVEQIGPREIWEPGDVLGSDREALDDVAHSLLTGRTPVRLRRIPAESPLVSALRRVEGHHAVVRTQRVTGTPTLTLDSSWSTPDAHFSTRRRADFRAALRRAERLGRVEFEVLSPGVAEAEELFAQFVRVESTGWKVRAGTALAVMHSKREFFARFCASAAADGFLRFAVLRIDGACVAVQLAAEIGGRYWLLKIAYDEAYARCSPGNLLLLSVVKWAADKHLGSVEFLGEEEPWIELWTKEVRACLDVQIFPRAPASLLAILELGARRARFGGRRGAGRLRTAVTGLAASVSLNGANS